MRTSFSHLLPDNECKASVLERWWPSSVIDWRHPPLTRLNAKSAGQILLDRGFRPKQKPLRSDAPCCLEFFQLQPQDVCSWQLFLLCTTHSDPSSPPGLKHLRPTSRATSFSLRLSSRCSPKASQNVKNYSASIVNVSNISVLMKGNSNGQFAYASSKAAFIHLTHALATTIYCRSVFSRTRTTSVAPFLIYIKLPAPPFRC